MGNMITNILLALFAAIILIAIIFYLNRNSLCPVQPVRNDGALPLSNNQTDTFESTLEASEKQLTPANKKPSSCSILRKNRVNAQRAQQIPQTPDRTQNRAQYQDQRSEAINEIINSVLSDNCSNHVAPSDPTASELASYFEPNHTKRSYLDECLLDNSNAGSSKDFIHKKRKYTKQTPDEIADLFDIEKMLPQETEEDWFDVVPMRSTKKICGTAMIHPKHHMGDNTQNSSMKNAIHDIRGDIPIPKISISPWMNSTIDPDRNIRGLC